jgi:hypothetical protein
MQRKLKKIETFVEYQNIIHEPPIQPAALFATSAQNDQATIEFWEHIWLANAKANHDLFGPFKDKSAMQDFRKYENLPCVVAGSGPSLKGNILELKNRGKLPIISCLHNFHAFEDADIPADYYVSLDAGKVTIEEVSEGGNKTAEEYWEITKDRTLIAFIASDPELLKKWKGRILFFNAPIPKVDLLKKIDEIELFNVNFSSGGNVLGAALYFAKAILGCHQTIFVGADFAFGYNRKFHSWDSKYDKDLGQYILATDIYGVKVPTWPTYNGFKKYFDSVALRMPGIYYNCTEGGTLGSYPEGNLSCFKYMDLKDCLKQFNLLDELKDSLTPDDPTKPKKLLYT